MALETTDQETGEVLTLEQAAAQMKPPPYWRKAEGISEGFIWIEYERAYLEAQREIGPVIEAEADNPFSKSKYASLAQLLAKISPIANKHGISIKQGCGRIYSHGPSDAAKRQLYLPIYTTLTHVASCQWERFLMEIPLVKLDAQAIGSAITYGRRYVLQAAWAIASTDDDGVLASRRTRVDASPVDEAVAGLIEHIDACQTLDELKAWHERNREGFDLLEEDGPAITALRAAYARRQKEIKDAPPVEDALPSKAPRAAKAAK